MISKQGCDEFSESFSAQTLGLCMSMSEEEDLLSPSWFPGGGLGNTTLETMEKGRTQQQDRGKGQILQLHLPLTKTMVFFLPF